MNSPDSNPSAATGVDRDHALHLLRAMIRIRRLEEKCAELYSAMKIRGFLHLYDGEEAVAVGVLQALMRPGGRSCARGAGGRGVRGDVRQLSRSATTRRT